ncbi:MAG: amphi-Trp domain-containing protein [Candidatus Njordarchaeia archaeon]
MQEVEEYEYEELYTKDQLADFLEKIAEQVRKGFEVSIPAPIKKDGIISLSISELVNIKISVKKRKFRTWVSLTFWSEPSKIREEVEEETEGESEEDSGDEHG